MNRIESIGMTRSRGRPASLNEARRALVNPDLRSVVLGSQFDGADIEEAQAEAAEAHKSLDAAGAASLAGRLFVVDAMTLMDDLGSVFGAAGGLGAQPPFDVTPIFMPGFAGGVCLLFILTRDAGNVTGLRTAIPSRNDETFYWAAPGFAAGAEEIVLRLSAALLTAINIRNLKPIGPPR
jgi:hypothetical protein